MITDAVVIQRKLEEFFMGSSNSLNIPELTRNDGSYLNDLFIDANNLQSIVLENFEQFPFALTSTDLREVNLTSLKQIRPRNALNSGAVDMSAAKFLTNTKLQTLVLPNLQGYFGTTDANSPAFANNYWLRVADLGNETIEQNNNFYFSPQWFIYNYFLEKIILRYSYVLPRYRGSALVDYSPFLSSSPIPAHFYVPKSLISAYRAASNWSNFGANAFLTIEDDLGEDYLNNSDTIPDSIRTWDQIAADCANVEAGSGDLDGDVYKIGATKTVEVDGCPTQMVLVGKNKDYIAPDGADATTIGGTTHAATTWIERTISRFTPINMTASGSYSAATYLQAELERIYNTLPAALQTNIKTVQKLTMHSGNTSGLATVSAEKVWIPSPGELNLGLGDALSGFYNGSTMTYIDYYRTSRPYYLGNSGLQPSNSQLIGLRSWRNTSRPDCLANDGTYVPSSTTVGNSTRYLIFGFCL